MCCNYLFAFGLYFPQTHTRIVGSTRSVSDASGPGSNREAEGRERTQQTRLTHRMNVRKCELADAFGLADRENIAKRATTTTIIKKKRTHRSDASVDCRVNRARRLNDGVGLGRWRNDDATRAFITPHLCSQMVGTLLYGWTDSSHVRTDGCNGGKLVCLHATCPNTRGADVLSIELCKAGIAKSNYSVTLTMEMGGMVENEQWPEVVT